MSRPRRTPTVIAASAAALLLLTGCTGSSPDDAASPAPPADLSAFHDQEPAPADCDEFLLAESDRQILAGVAQTPECSRVDVPVDYDDPDGERANLAVMRIPAIGDDPIGSLVVNPGGPGQPGTSFGAVVALLLSLEQNPILERFDIVGFDPRGTGASEPSVDCFTDAERDADPTLAMPMLFPAAHAWTEESAAEFAQKCAEGSGGENMLEHIGTVDAANDMDVLRAVLGDEKLTYAGGSWGTRLGAVYAEMFPDRVRAMVLDGAIHPEQSTLERLVDQTTGVQGAFDDLAAWCATDVPDCPFGTDPAQATEVFQQVMQPLNENPLPTSDGRELGYAGAVAGALNALFASSSWGGFVAAFAELKAGLPDAMLALQDAFFLREADGAYGNFTEANMAYNCNDEDRNAPEVEREMRETITAEAPILDPGAPIPADLVSACAAWPGEQTLPWPHAVEFPGLPKTLVMAVTGDPATPAAVSELLAERMGADFLPVQGRQHGAMFVGMSTCVNMFVADYLIDGETPPSGSSCALDGQEPVMP